MVRACQVILIVVCISMHHAHALDMNLDQIVEHHTQAIGGKAAIERVKSIEFSLNIVEPKFNVDGIYRADRKLRMRIDIYAGVKRVFTEAYDGRKAWQMGDDGTPKEASPKGTAALKNGILFPGKLFGLHESRATGHKLKLMGREEVDNKNFYVVKLTTAEGDVTQLYVNPENWLIERTRVKKALHPDIDPKEKWSETRFSDFRKSDGLLRSFKSVQVDLESGEVMQTTTVKQITTNPPLDDSLFQAER